MIIVAISTNIFHELFDKRENRRLINENNVIIYPGVDGNELLDEIDDRILILVDEVAQHLLVLGQRRGRDRFFRHDGSHVMVSIYIRLLHR